MCNHDDEINDNEFHLCKNSLDSFDGHEDFMRSAEIDGRGNCCENYSTLERYLKNASELSEGDDDAWMSIEHRQNFLERQNRHHHKHQENEFGSSKNFDETLDIDDDGLIGFEEAKHPSMSTFVTDEHGGANNIELISYENNFNLYNSFWWA